MDRSQLLKGTLDVALLELVARGPNYGNGLFQALQAAGFTDVADASVYGALRRMEADGLLASETVPSEQGPPRKYFSLTAAGRARHRDARRAWDEVAAAMERIRGDR